jgi:hypothetical protein
MLFGFPLGTLAQPAEAKEVVEEGTRADWTTPAELSEIVHGPPQELPGCPVIEDKDLLPNRWAEARAERAACRAENVERAAKPAQRPRAAQPRERQGQ